MVPLRDGPARPARTTCRTTSWLGAVDVSGKPERGVCFAHAGRSLEEQAVVQAAPFSKLCKLLFQLPIARQRANISDLP
jgi:hypothetical protein